MSTLDGHNGGNQEFETFDLDPNAEGNSFSLQASQEAWAPRDNRVEQVSNTMGYSGDSYPISEGLARTCTDACSRQHRQDSIPWGGATTTPRYEDYRGGNLDTGYSIPMSREMQSLVVIQKGGSQDTRYGGNYYGGWNQPYGQSGDGKTIVVQGSGADVYDRKEEVVVGDVRVTDDRTSVTQRRVETGGGFGNEGGFRTGGTMDDYRPTTRRSAPLEGWTPKEVIGGLGVVLQGASDIIGAKNGNYRGNNPWQNNPYQNRDYGRYQNNPGGNKTIIVQGGGNVYDRREEVVVGDVRVSDDTTIVTDRHGRVVGTPPFVPERRGNGADVGTWTPKEVIGGLGVILNGTRDIISARKGGQSGNYYDYSSGYDNRTGNRFQNVPRYRR